jgi:hypothetical protein
MIIDAILILLAHDLKGNFLLSSEKTDKILNYTVGHTTIILPIALGNMMDIGQNDRKSECFNDCYQYGLIYFS